MKPLCRLLPVLALLVGCPSDPSAPVTVVPVPSDTAMPVETPVVSTPPTSRPALPCEVEQTESAGRLCAIRPSALDPETRDAFGSTGQDRLLGLGLHVVALPTDPDPTKPLWIHFTGTGGRPYDPIFDSMTSGLWLNELMAEGYTVVQVAYVNRTAVNDSCQTVDGRARDNCAGEVREEVLVGADVSPFREVSVADSVDHRLEVLLDHLLDHDVTLPADLQPDALDWPTIRTSGHSQGGNLAYYLARNRGVAFACMLGSPYDVGDDVNPSFPPIADWFRAGTSLTAVSALGQVLATEDENAGPFRAAAALIGLTVGQEAFEVTGAPYTNADGEAVDGHAAPLVDPDLQSLRAMACFR